MRNVKAGHSKPIVCLDAGHYGKYNQSPAVKTYYESEMTWKLHNYLAAELESYGIQVKKTRSAQGSDLSLSKRGEASKGCDLFLSIHSNAVGSKANETVDYPVVIVQLDGKGDALGMELAKTIEEIMGTKQAGSIGTKKGVYGEYYGVLRSSAAVGTMGMILEHSFHTNTRIAKWLMEDANLRKLARAEAEIIADWFGVEKPTEKLHRVQVGAFSNIENAKTMVEKLKAAGFEGAYIKSE